MDTRSLFAASIRPRRLPSTNIESLANETLTQVAEHVIDDDIAFTGLMLTCKRLAGVCEYLRYTSLSVQGSKGRRLLAMLLSGSPTANRYCRRVKRAWFKYWHDAEMYIVSALMCEVLPLLVNLITLRIDAHTIDVNHTLNWMTRSGLIRSCRHPAYSLETLSSSASTFSLLTLPNVQNIMIAGNYTLASIANHRSLTELTLESFLDYDDLADFLAGAENTLLGKTLSVLSIKLVRSIDLRMTVPVLSMSLRKLNRLSIEQAALNFMVSAVPTSILNLIT